MLRLKRIRAGLYRTKDGKFDIQKDPMSGDEPGGSGFISWLVFENGDPEPLPLGGTVHQGTLYEARTRLETLLSREKTK